MSCYWDVICLDCNDWAGLNLNKDPNSCVEVMLHADAIGELTGLFADDLWKLTFTISSSEGGTIDRDWFAKHKGHTKHVGTDGGKFFGDCDHPDCNQPAKHWGDHVFEEFVPPSTDEKWLLRLARVKASLLLRGKSYLEGYMAAKGLHPDGSRIKSDAG